MKNKLAKKEINIDKLTVEEIEDAENKWIKSIQNSLLSNSDYKKYKEQLGIVEENEFLVCKGRLQYSELELSTKEPIILPKFDRFTELVIMDCHEKVHHCLTV